MGTYCVPHTVLGNGDTMIRQDKFPDFMVYFSKAGKRL